MNDSSLWSIAKRVNQLIDDGLIEIAKKDISEIESHLAQSNNLELKQYVKELHFKIYGNYENIKEKDELVNKNELHKNQTLNEQDLKINLLDQNLSEMKKDLGTIKNIMIFFLVLSLLSIFFYLISFLQTI